ESIRVDRTGRPSEHVERPALALTFAVQPSVLRDQGRKRAMRGRGLLARFWYFVPQTMLGRRELDPPPVPDEVTLAYHERLGELLNLPPQPPKPASSRGCGGCGGRFCTLSDEAHLALREFRGRIEGRLHPDDGDLFAMSDWAGKISGGVVRIAGLLHFAEHG